MEEKTKVSPKSNGWIWRINEPVFYNYFCSLRNDGGAIALYVGSGSMIWNDES